MLLHITAVSELAQSHSGLLLLLLLLLLQRGSAGGQMKAR
jgi:hypothetical protein